MTPEQYQRAADVFARAVALPKPERVGFVEGECADDAAVLKQVEQMLLADGDDTATIGELSSGAGDGMHADDVIHALRAPEQIGRYRIIEPIGEGGMGTVYRAEQTEPVRREVALKLIKLGMDTKEVVARFQSERQALAVMDHTGIARVFDAGATPEGRPYFVMELVRGLPVTRFCDEHKLTTRLRIDLFIKICEAVQHAHQKGIIHRDLKPSNIIVSMQNDRPVPKIIDFGIAKAAGADLSDRTMHTGLGQLVGTPEYMSPEQADPSAQDIDTRTDIYSLGVVLYELLVGVLPFNRGEMQSQPSDKLGRFLRDTAAAKPSSRLSMLGADATKVADCRGTNLSTLRRTIAGDLDWIVLTSIAKDRAERYATSDALANDLRAYFEYRPITAHPPSALKLAVKFTRRNRAFTLGVVTAVVLTIVATISTSYGFIAASRERDIKELEAAKAVSISEFLTDMLSNVEPDIAQGQDVSVRSVLEESARKLDAGELGDQAEVVASLRQVIGRCYMSLGRYDDAIDQTHKALELTRNVQGGSHADTARAIELLASAQTAAGNYTDAEVNFLAAIDVRTQLGDEAYTQIEPASLGSVYHWTGRFDQAETYFRDALAGIPEEDMVNRGHALSWLGTVLEVLGRVDESIECHKDAVEAYRSALGSIHTDVASALNTLANALESAGQYDQARQAHEESLSIKRLLLRDAHPDIAASLSNLAIVLIRQGEPVPAENMLREALDIRMNLLGEGHPSTAVTYANLGRALQDQGKLDDALVTIGKAEQLAVSSVGNDHVMTIAFGISRGYCLSKMGRYTEAERVLLDGHSRIVAAVGEGHRRVEAVRGYLNEMYEKWDRPGEAAKWGNTDE